MGVEAVTGGGAEGLVFAAGVSDALELVVGSTLFVGAGVLDTGIVDKVGASGLGAMGVAAKVGSGVEGAGVLDASAKGAAGVVELDAVVLEAEGAEAVGCVAKVSVVLGAGAEDVDPFVELEPVVVSEELLGGGLEG